MKYVQKLKKIGNSVGIIIPRQILEKLRIGVGSEVYLEQIQDKLLIEKEDAGQISPEFLKAAESLADRYEDAFKELSKA